VTLCSNIIARASELQKCEKKRSTTIDFNGPTLLGVASAPDAEMPLMQLVGTGNVDVTFQPEDSSDWGGWTSPLVESRPQKFEDQRTICRC